SIPSISRPSSIGRTTPQKSITAPAPATSLPGAISASSVTEISQTTFGMHLNCSLKFPLVYRASYRCHSERSEESSYFDQLRIQFKMPNLESVSQTKHDLN